MSSTEIGGEVTFHLKDGIEEQLFAKAAEVDMDNNGEAEDKYTVAQALQVVWHLEPEWLHKNVLLGWTLDKATDEEGVMRRIWEVKP